MKKFLITIVVLSVLTLIIYAALFSPGIPYSNGTRSGVIRRISHKGLMLKTWEGELDLITNEQNGVDAIVREIFHFSVSSPEIAAEIREKEKAGKRTTLYYREYMLRGVRHGMTNYDIYKVEE